ncbi:MAG: D-alanyl-D-alanine carboxypeptidase/D-alanyl-D-alanine-endopeptidase [Gammaproteobacteria bacterium]|nr:MAG: D-alanyl-D-alanine carboxypeptidase/D-alanyl-D-alanine-endopeptidase [Gammaproteobacteria bacterium]
MSEQAGFSGFRVARVVALFFVFLVFIVPVYGSEIRGAVLPPEVQKILQKYGIPSKSLSVYIHGVDDEQPILAWQADTPRNPASTIKLLTTLVALEELGPAYRWKTEFFTSAPVQRGLMDGDVYFKGYGDPFLVTEYLWRMVRDIRRKGLQHITGDLVLDGSYFETEGVDPALFDGQPYRSYNVSPGALLLNFQSVFFSFQPDVNSGRIAITADPAPGLSIQNKIQLKSGRCGAWSKRIKLDVIQDERQQIARFTGRYAGSCGNKGFYRAIGDAEKYFYEVFKNLWLQQRGYFNGDLTSGGIEGVNTPYYVRESLPLSDILRLINKYSNNVMARQLLLTLGAEREGVPGTTEKGLRVIHDWLQRKGKVFPELVLENGAGLSRRVRISAQHLGELLRDAYRSPFMPEFISSLPIAALDGTLRKRFKGSPLQGRLHLKTGLLDDVRAMAGYFIDPHGKRWVVVSLHNHARAPGRAGEAVQEALLAWLQKQSSQNSL